MIRCKIKLDLKKKQRLRNKFQHLNKEHEESVGRVNDNLTTVITESAAAVETAASREETENLAQKTTEIIAKHNNMKASSTMNQTELAEFSKLINRCKKTTFERILYKSRNTGSRRKLKSK